ncbi:MAG TPA: TIM barrel protein [Ideonella sp.]|uniref:hydroxypyruvate isomerase family protein n=1 Tax=Ideonella sp. TaxID=1929293 RepID=UPI002E30645E|nr:TIM barrel protein [Ideonella sp.]HEX5683536.1 TIM barrel protein [Ideonella sp.]
MLRFAANLTLLYPDLGFAERIGAAARDGFDGLECQFPYDWPAAELATRATDAGLPWVLINTPAGDWAGGERGLAALPGRETEFRRGIDTALAYADALGCRRLHTLAGVMPDGADRQRCLATYAENLAWAARQAVGAGCDILIEPLNPRDVPGYLLATQADAHRWVQVIGAPNLKVQMDLYHCQVSEGDLATKLRQHLPSGRVGHLQIAGVPGRHEPDDGELNAPYLFALIDRLATGHDLDPCWIGAEYNPRRGAAPGGTAAGLGWLAAARAPHVVV